MKASELIKKLQANIEEYGDCECGISDYGILLPVDEISTIQINKTKDTIGTYRIFDYIEEDSTMRQYAFLLEM